MKILTKKCVLIINTLNYFDLLAMTGYVAFGTAPILQSNYNMRLAKTLETISYEVFTSVAERVKRIYTISEIFL
ncbi:MAG: hypothetical protein LBP63_02550 [Prevotellaceae bacterium]|nr:hypothetical protein [Prevotellaceae bacterium]